MLDLPRTSCLIGIVVALSASRVCSQDAIAMELHVSPAGSDTNAGSAQEPLATPHRAVAALEQLARRRDDAAIRVVLHEGVFRISEPLVIRRRDVPPKGSVSFVAAERAKVVISGGQTIVGWSSMSDGTWTAPLPAAARGKWRFRELYVNGQRRTRARHPNKGYLRIDSPFPDKRSGFTFNAGDLPEDWTAAGELVFLHDWSISRMPIASVDHARRRLTAAFPIGSRADHYKIDHFETHPRYFVENHPAFLDTEGEWILDEDQGRLTYRPVSGERLEAIEVVAPLATSLVVVRGDETAPVRNVHFRGLHFEHCGWQLPAAGYAAGQATAYDAREESQPRRRFIPPAIRVELAENCSFERIRIAHLGTSGIEFGSRTRRCRLEDSIIEDVSGNGLNLGEDTARLVDGRPWWQIVPEQAAQEHLVAHNRIVECGRQFFGAVAVWVGLARDTRIVNNKIACHPYTGVSLGWMWNPTATPAGGNIVADNHIHHVMQILSDGGGIYTLGRQPGTRLLRNVIHDVPLNVGRAESNGMFLDEGSDLIEIEGNVIYDVDRSPLRFHRAQQMTVRGNTLVVSAPETTPLRYNNTDPRTIRQIQNRILQRTDFNPGDVHLPAAGPRSASEKGS